VTEPGHSNRTTTIEPRRDACLPALLKATCRGASLWRVARARVRSVPRDRRPALPAPTTTVAEPHPPARRSGAAGSRGSRRHLDGEVVRV